jgi:hypothetical protein
VGVNEEQDITTRLEAFKAQGFLGFYSTIISAGLSTRIRQLSDKYEPHIMDGAMIERSLLSDERLRSVFEQHFPVSFREYMDYYRQPHNVLTEYLPLSCHHCQTDLLTSDPWRGVVNVWFRDPGDEGQDVWELVNVVPSCKKECDYVAEEKARRAGCTTKWEDLEDLRIPSVFLNWVLKTVRDLHTGQEKFSEEGLEAFLDFTARMSQAVLRPTTSEQFDRKARLDEIPDWA